jgi:hypothetical protein
MHSFCFRLWRILFWLLVRMVLHMQPPEFPYFNSTLEKYSPPMNCYLSLPFGRLVSGRKVQSLRDITRQQVRCSLGAHWVHIWSTGTIDVRIGKLRIYKLEIDWLGSVIGLSTQGLLQGPTTPPRHPQIEVVNYDSFWLIDWRILCKISLYEECFVSKNLKASTKVYSLAPISYSSLCQLLYSTRF